ncbi:MAG: hypothetical protein DRQ06_06250, partial [Candidatus Hydrothermota bacterium]
WDRPLIYIDIDVWYCVDYNSFVYPIYRYKRPHHGVYPDPGYKPYRTSPPKPWHWKKTPPKVTPVSTAVAAKKEGKHALPKGNKAIHPDHGEKRLTPREENRRSSIWREERKETSQDFKARKAKKAPDKRTNNKREKQKPRLRPSVEKAKEILTGKFNPHDILRRKAKKDKTPGAGRKKHAARKSPSAPIKLDISGGKRR